MATCAHDALLILRKKDICFTLMMTDVNLPDRNALEFVRMVERETRLPIVLMCDASDQQVVMDGLTSGAVMLGLVKPLRVDDFKNLWQLPFLKRREIALESRPSLIPGTASAQHHQVGIDIPESSTSQNRKRRADEMEIGSGFPMGQTPPLLWTPDLHNRFLEAVNNLGFFATPQEITSRINVPRVTVDIVAQKLQQLNISLNQQNIVAPPGFTLNILATPSNILNIVAPSATAANLNFTVNQHVHQLSNNNHNPHFMVNQQMHQTGNNNHNQGVTYRQGHTPLALLMQNPHSRDQLRRIVMVSQRNWGVRHGVTVPELCALNNYAVGQGLSQVPPMSVPAALATKIELCVYAVLNSKYAPPGSTLIVPDGDYDMLGVVLELLAGR